MRRPGPHFGNHPRVRSGVFYFLLVLVLLQLATWGVPGVFRSGKGEGLVRPDTLKQALLDRLKAQLPQGRGWTLRPFDPNGLEDFKGYLLGIPHQALDSLYAFRSRGGVLYNFEQFRQVSGLPDSIIQRLSPYLAFPTYGKRSGGNPKAQDSAGKDLNAVSASELQSVSGIGPVLSGRIIKFRDALGGFLDPSQLFDVYGLRPEVARRVMKAFPLESIPSAKRVSVNKGTVEELASLLYLTPEMAEAIVARRDSLGPYQSLEELRQIKSIPKTKIDRIALYLEL